MIAAAGYLNYSGKLFESTDDSGVSQQANSELLDISEEDIETGSGDIESQDQDASEETDGDVEGTPGEAVLTSGEVKNTVAQARYPESRYGRKTRRRCRDYRQRFCDRGTERRGGKSDDRADQGG